MVKASSPKDFAELADVILLSLPDSTQINEVVKELELVRELCQDNECPNFTLNTALQLYRIAQRKGYGRNDSSSVIKMVREEYEKK